MVRFGLGALTRRISRTRSSPATTAGYHGVDLSACVNAEFFRMLLQAPYQHIDVSKEGGVGYDEFAAYFAWVATDEELRFAFDVLRQGSERDRLTYGTLQSFQQQYDAELFANLKQGKVGCPDYLEYCTLLLGIRTHCKRPDFLALEGVAVPPRPAWLLARLEEEWTSRETLEVHWRYVTQPVPERSEERRFPDWNGGFSVRDEGHEGFTVQDFLRCPEALQAGLCDAEVLALRLYTGPGYEPLNKSLRANSQRFPVTQYCIDSAVGKLAQIGVRRPLLRGMKKRMHPRWARQYDLYRGVGDKRIALSDPAFVSTTTDLEVANGSNFGGPILFVLHTADVRGQRGCFLSLGAELDWVSQYPGEAEVLLPSNAIFIPRLRCKHTQDHGLDVPPSKNVYEFDVFYPWDFEHNCPLITNDYLAVANQLLLLQHEVDLRRSQACREGHPLRYEEQLRDAPPPPSRTVSPAKAVLDLTDHMGRPLKGKPLQQSRSPSRSSGAPEPEGPHKGPPSEVPSPMRCSSDVGTCFSSDFACIYIRDCEDPIFGHHGPGPALHPSFADSPVSLQSPDGRSFKSLDLALATALTDGSDLSTLPSPARSLSLSSLQDYAFAPVDLPAGWGSLAGTDALRLKKLKLYTQRDVDLLEKGIGVKPAELGMLATAVDAMLGAFPAQPSVYCRFEDSAWDMGRLVFALTSVALLIGLPTTFVSFVGSLSTAMAVGLLATAATAATAVTVVPIAVVLTQGSPTVLRQTPTVTLTATVTLPGTSTATTSATPPSTISPTPSGTGSPTATVLRTVSATATLTASRTGTPSPSVTVTASRTPSPSRTPTATHSQTSSPAPTPTGSVTGTASLTGTETRSPSSTPTGTATFSRTSSVSSTATATRTQSPTPSPLSTPSPTTTNTGTHTGSRSLTHTPTCTYTCSPSASGTVTISATATRTASLSRTTTHSPTRTASRTFTGTLSNTGTHTTSISPTPTSSPTPTQTGSLSLTTTRTAVSSLTPTSTATGTKTRTSSLTHTRSCTATRSQTVSPTHMATLSPTSSGTSTQSRTLSLSGTASPTRSCSSTTTRSNTETASGTISHTRTWSSTPTPTRTSSRTLPATVTATPTRTGTSTPSVTATPTRTAPPTLSASATGSATLSGSPTPTYTGTRTRSSTATRTHTPTATCTSTGTQTPTSSHTATATPTATPSDTRSGTASRTQTLSRTATPTPSATLSTTRSETASRTQTVSRTVTTTPSTTATHTPSPTATPHTNTTTPSPTRTTDPPVCVNFGPADYVAGTVQAGPIVSIELVARFSNLAQFGVPICGNYYYTDKYWGTFFGATVVYSAVPGGQWWYWSTMNPVVNPNDGQWHTVILAGSQLTIDGVPMNGTIPNYLNTSSTVYIGFYPNRYPGPGGTMGGNFALRSVRLWSSTNVSSTSTLIGTLGFNLNGSLKTSGATWTKSTSNAFQYCSGI